MVFDKKQKYIFHAAWFTKGEKVEEGLYPSTVFFWFTRRWAYKQGVTKLRL